MLAARSMRQAARRSASALDCQSAVGTSYCLFPMSITSRRGVPQGRRPAVAVQASKQRVILVAVSDDLGSLQAVR